MMRIVIGALVAIVVTAPDARAQMTMGSFRGYLTGHVGAITGGEASEERLAIGASVAVQEQTGWGAEIDFGHSSDVAVGAQFLDVTSYFVNASWVKPDGLIRPYGVAGAGVLQVNGCGTACTRASRTYDFGVSAGGGAFVLVHEVAALRADVRYFFSSADHPDLRRPDGLGFWRLSIGATFIWAVVP
jgi:hypothetical protein